MDGWDYLLSNWATSPVENNATYTAAIVVSGGILVSVGAVALAVVMYAILSRPIVTAYITTACCLLTWSEHMFATVRRIPTNK